MSQGPKTDQVSSRVPSVPYAVAIAAVVAVVALLAGSWLDGTFDRSESGAEAPIPEQFAPVVVSGRLAPIPDDGPDPSIGKQMPKVSGTTFDGEPLVIEPGKGHLVLVVSHHCPTCQRMVDLVAEALDTTPTGVKVVAVSTDVDDERPFYPASEWFEGQDGWDLGQVMMDSVDGEAAEALGADTQPYLLAANSSGVVFDRVDGVVPVDRIVRMLEAAST